MRITQIITLAFATVTVSAASLPQDNALEIRDPHIDSVPRSEILSPEHSLEKRKGGGGKGGGGGGGGGGKSGGKSGGGGGSTSGRTSPSSNAGGSTKSGSGPARSYGGGGYYGGGASTPYSAGKQTPKKLNPGLLLLPGAALLIFPGLWLWSVYPYHLNSYRFYNQTAQNRSLTARGEDQELPVICLCQEFSVCGCDENDDPSYLNDLVGNGSYPALNKTLVTVSDVNGTRTLVLNGTLPNGTTAPGGTDDAGVSLRVGKYSGYWVMGMIVFSTVAFL